MTGLGELLASGEWLVASGENKPTKKHIKPKVKGKRWKVGSDCPQAADYKRGRKSDRITGEGLCRVRGLAGPVQDDGRSAALNHPN